MTGPAGADDLPTDSTGQRYVLRLYVTGSTPRSARAIENMRRICEEHLAGRYDLEVIDIYQRPEAAREFQLIAAPTLVKLLPEPLRRIVGDLSDRDKVLHGLDLLPPGNGAAPEG
jgi:circadian clock protein KaiB